MSAIGNKRDRCFLRDAVNFSFSNFLSLIYPGLSGQGLKKAKRVYGIIGKWLRKGLSTMRYKVELLDLSETGDKRVLFFLVVSAQNENDAIMMVQKEYAITHPDSPLPPPGFSWISYRTCEEDCWG